MTIKLRKAIIRTGTFNRPDGKGTFDVTRSRLDHWAATFKDMKKNGINVPVVVDHIVDVAHTVGRISGVERVGDFLFASLEFPTKEHADLTQLNDVSIGTKDLGLLGKILYQEAKDGQMHTLTLKSLIVQVLVGVTVQKKREKR